MVDAHEAELAALREQETEVRRAVEQARLQAEQTRQLLEADTVEARLAPPPTEPESSSRWWGSWRGGTGTNCPARSMATTTSNVQRRSIPKGGPGDIAQI